MTLPVSVCIPTYNGASYLRECLDSVLLQSFSDFEVILSDDRSSDDTLEIAREYAANDKRIRIFQNEKNLGLVGNWNRTIGLAEGKWIKFLFQDDLMAPLCLEKMMSATKDEIPLVFCKRNFLFDANLAPRTRVWFERLLTLDKIYPNTEFISAEGIADIVLKEIDLNFIGEPTAVLLRKEVFSHFGFFNPFFIQLCDLEFWLRVAVHGGLIYLAEPLVTFRVHSKSTSSLNNANRHFRAEKLEKLILLHEYCFNPLFEPLRHAASRGTPPIDLLKLFAYCARRVKNSIAAITEKSIKEKYRKEWDSLLTFFPGLAIVSNRYFLMPVRIKERMAKFVTSPLKF